MDISIRHIGITFMIRCIFRDILTSKGEFS